MRTIGLDTLPEGSTVHKFELAGLGKAPFTFIGMEVKVGPIRCGDGSEIGAPGQPMGTCQYCGTGIKDCYYLRSADGKEFYVGSSCIGKTGDKGLLRVVKIEEKKKRDAKNEAIRKKAAEKFITLKAEVEGRIKSDGVLRDKLSKKPHPMITKYTLLDYIEWMLVHAGLSGIERVKGIIKMEDEVHA